jgi:hypothetical protein
VAHTAPAVNHLLFADDSLLFLKASDEGAREIVSLLEQYCNASGQRINLDKSSIFFSKGCPEGIRESIKAILNVANETLNEKYLGMPSDVGRSKSGVFKYLKDRIWKKIQGWLEQILASGGKEVLIKSVAQAIPVFSMSCFKLPRGLCSAINSMLQSFWWGCKDGKRKTCWVSWETMCSPKFAGGLGFRDIELFNLAMLARQAWRILQNPATLSARILKAVYFPTVDFLQASLGHSPSQVWRALVEGRDMMAQGLIRRIGTGESTNAWDQNWLPRDFMLRPLACKKRNPPMRVAEFIDQTSATWRVERIQEFFLPMDAEVIQSIPLSTRRMDDRWAWHYERNGILTVRSVYRLLVQTKKRMEDWLEDRGSGSNGEREQRDWQRLWKVQVPSKLRIFLWRLAHHSLPTADVRHRRRMAETNRCSICGDADSWRHSLINCTVARCVWALADEGVTEHMCADENPSPKQWLFAMMETLPRDDFARVAVTLWAIWFARRKIIHEEVYQSPLSTHLFIQSYLQDLSISVKKERVQGGQSVVHPKWIAPLRGCAKINVDAAIAKEGHGGAVAAVCRSEEVNFLGASALRIEGIGDPSALEAVACREALALAEDLYLQKVTVATDCMQVINNLERPYAGSYSMIIDEIKARSRSFVSVSFKHENRASNREPHSLARSSVSNSVGRQVWLLEPPDGLCIPYNVMNQ